MVGLVILNPSFYHPNDILEKVEKSAIGLVIADPKEYKVKVVPSSFLPSQVFIQLMKHYHR
jgi:hypothetical protein